MPMEREKSVVLYQDESNIGSDLAKKDGFLLASFSPIQSMTKFLLPKMKSRRAKESLFVP